jgi:hypothetical protein
VKVSHKVMMATFLLAILNLSYVYAAQERSFNTIVYSSYPDYEELTQICQILAKSYPSLAKLKSAGKSLQGRELWYMEITDFKTRFPRTKPAVYMDGNMHAAEVLGTNICIGTIEYLLNGYESDPNIHELLQNYTFIIFPRVSPDGAEYFLKTPYRTRSVLRPYPFQEEQDGLYPEDIDGDGHIVQMRIRHPDGDWKVSKKDARLMIQKNKKDKRGPFYKLYDEGLIRNYDGKKIKSAPPRYGIDLNRNFPANWDPKQTGSGPFPLSEPESRAIADIVRDHPNIGIRVCYHTAAGTINRPFNTKPDSEMPGKDLAAYEILGRLGKSLSGYPMVSVYEEFGTKNQPLKGTSLEWSYEHMGLFSFVFESWDIEKKAGCGGYERKIPFHKKGIKYIRTEEDWLKIFKWADDVVGKEGFKTWHPFNHPQLGNIEIGGWKRKFILNNPPPKLIEEEINNDMMFGIEVAKKLPLIRIESITVSEEKNDLCRVSAKITNIGFFPTNVTEQAKLLKRAKKVTAEIKILSGAELVGQTRQDVGHLEGTWRYKGADKSFSHKIINWTFRITDPDKFKAKVKVISEKAGTHELEIKLPRQK